MISARESGASMIEPDGSSDVSSPDPSSIKPDAPEIQSMKESDKDFGVPTLESMESSSSAVDAEKESPANDSAKGSNFALPCVQCEQAFTFESVYSKCIIVAAFQIMPALDHTDEYM